MEATAAAGPGATPAVEAVAGSARLLPAEPPSTSPAGSRRSPARPGPAADAPAARPDVTVSIGHIEVRSAPVPDSRAAGPRSGPRSAWPISLVSSRTGGHERLPGRRRRERGPVLAAVHRARQRRPNDDPGAHTGITATSPDLIPTGANEQPRLNLFMYYIGLNPALRNLGLPSANAQGTRLSNPELALDLHYLVTAYGSTQFAPEILLAWAMKVFHDTPVVPSQTIQAALDGLAQQHQPSTEASLISGSRLAEQIEHLRITPEVLTTEEIYRLWTSFQTAYRPSTALQVSVVVIKDTQAFTSNLPVQARTVTAQPLQAPVITSVSPSHGRRGPGADHHREQLPRRAARPTPSWPSPPAGAAGTVPADAVQGNLIRVDAAHDAGGRHANGAGPANDQLARVGGTAPGFQLQPGAVPAHPDDPGPRATGYAWLPAHLHGLAGRRPGAAGDALHRRPRHPDRRAPGGRACLLGNDHLPHPGATSAAGRIPSGSRSTARRARSRRSGSGQFTPSRAGGRMTSGPGRDAAPESLAGALDRVYQAIVAAPGKLRPPPTAQPAAEAADWRRYAAGLGDPGSRGTRWSACARCSGSAHSSATCSCCAPAIACRAGSAPAAPAAGTVIARPGPRSGWP